MIKVILGLHITVILVSFILNMSADSQDTLYFSVLIASLITFLNFIVAVILFRISVRKKNKTFLIYNFGGMVFRLIFILVLLLICIISLKIDQYAFIFTFLVFYLISLIGEIGYFHKKQLDIKAAK